jgi:hypothetical protein
MLDMERLILFIYRSEFYPTSILRHLINLLVAPAQLESLSLGFQFKKLCTPPSLMSSSC